ncbi:porin PorA family protein, partial [Streptomyces lydicus]
MALSAGTRRTVACLLVGLGALLIVAALMIPTYTVGKLAKTPLDLEITTIATNQPGEESLVLDSKSLTGDGVAKIDKDVNLVSQRFLTVEEPSDASEMTVQAGSTLRRTD